MKTRILGAATAALAATALAAPAAQAVDGPDRIVGGSASTSSPGAAALHVISPRTGQEVFGCSASMLSPTKVLTARHCTDGYQETHVRVGSLNRSSGGTKHNVASVVEHPSTDLAILTLATPASGTKTVKLATADPQVGETNTLYGWGRTAFESDSSPVLKQANVPVQGTNSTPAYGGKGIKSGVGNGHAWKGDSGGPQFNAAGQQVGVCSIGGFGVYQVYVSVANYRSWITSNAGL
ncbi:S1 family peptidase [Demetria terragena]|uniref:S1 family peptidase n=1 Tax=Demetria terragena TaxID=63959 RepID=UPI000372F04E|nr:trypsin-like serine protease [Demetria terragena]